MSAYVADVLVEIRSRTQATSVATIRNCSVCRYCHLGCEPRSVVDRYQCYISTSKYRDRRDAHFSFRSNLVLYWNGSSSPLCLSLFSSSLSPYCLRSSYFMSLCLHSLLLNTLFHSLSFFLLPKVFPFSSFIFAFHFCLAFFFRKSFILIFVSAS